MDFVIASIFVGTVATAITDAWSLVRKHLFDIPQPNYGLVGRWIAYMRHGRFRHDSIAAAPAVRGERVIGWVAHYLIGISFAALLLAVFGPDWVHHPALAPALVVGICTVAAPFLLMQPGMGAGIAASRTPRPAMARIQSLITHAIFGIGLYAAGWANKLLLLSQ